MTGRCVVVTALLLVAVAAPAAGQRSRVLASAGVEYGGDLGWDGPRYVVATEALRAWRGGRVGAVVEAGYASGDKVADGRVDTAWAAAAVRAAVGRRGFAEAGWLAWSSRFADEGNVSVSGDGPFVGAGVGVERRGEIGVRYRAASGAHHEEVARVRGWWRPSSSSRVVVGLHVDTVRFDGGDGMRYGVFVGLGVWR